MDRRVVCRGFCRVKDLTEEIAKAYYAQNKEAK